MKRHPTRLTRRMPLSGRKSLAGPGSTPPGADRSRYRQPRSATPSTSRRRCSRGCSKRKRIGAAQEGNRLPCLQLLPVEANAAARLQRVLDNAAQRAKTRVNQIMTYAEGRRCRHAEPRRPSRRTPRNPAALPATSALANRGCIGTEYRHSVDLRASGPPLHPQMRSSS